ncbi:MAG: DUF2786 domain-containing protein [Actinomycetota bacterium]|nr:DUF2786 domain-containing protein [Actinomycetota bacterium]
MSRTAAERRAARKRKQQHRGRHRAESAGQQSDATLLVRHLLHAGAMGAAGLAEVSPEEVAVRLAELDPGVDGTGLASGLLAEQLAGMEEHGWQPADAVHVVRRKASARAVRLAVALVLARSAQLDAAAWAPEEWLFQLSALETEIPGARGGPAAPVAAWRLAEALDAGTAWREVLTVTALWLRAVELAPVGPPPSRWGAGAQRQGTPGRRATSSSAPDSRVLGRIRGLLAKAESTEFPEEAEALTAKAQQLMTRYAVDAAVLDAEQGRSFAAEVRARRVHVEDPYTEEKVRLLDEVGRANAVRVVLHRGLGMATAVGLPVDLELTELLFTSLLVQATRAMAETGRAGNRRTRSPSFRRAFLLAYAIRIGERLAQARDETTAEAESSAGTSLVPVLTARAQAVDETLSELFPDLVHTSTRVSNAQGWHAGRLAAEHADLRRGRGQVTR